MLKNKRQLNIISIILARGGSKGIKNKNLKKFNDKPLIYWSIKSSLNSKLIKETWVSSDSKKILNYSKKIGANIILRPKKHSNDHASSDIAWWHATNVLKRKKFDLVVGIQPTSPLRDKDDFDKGIMKFIDGKYDSLFSSVSAEDIFLWKFKNKKLIANYDYKNRPRRQDIKDSYLENGSFYIFKKEGMIKFKNRLFGKIGTYKMKIINSYQIDTLLDWKIITLLSKFK